MPESKNTICACRIINNVSWFVIHFHFTATSSENTKRNSYKGRNEKSWTWEAKKTLPNYTENNYSSLLFCLHRLWRCWRKIKTSLKHKKPNQETVLIPFKAFFFLYILETSFNFFFQVSVFFWIWLFLRMHFVNSLLHLCRYFFVYKQ